MDKKNDNYYIEIAEKYFSSVCDDDSFNNNINLAKNLFDNTTLDCITYCYIINYSIFLYNYEKVNNSDTNSYLSLKQNEMNELIFECKQLNKENYNQKEWNRLRYYKTIKNIVIDYCTRIYESDDVYKSSDKNELINKMVEIFNDFIDTGQYKSKKTYPMFGDIVGLDEAKLNVKEKIIDPVLYKDIYSKYDISIGGGILLYGLPGTGKTMFAQAVANEIDGHFISIKSSDLKSKYYGDTEQKVKEIFDEARKYEISVLFFDEFEAIGVSRDKRGAEITAETIVPELLAQMQGFEKNEKTILIIAATNRPWDIDSALLRPGRFDSLIYIDLPNEKLRCEMFKKNLSSINVEDDIVEYLSSATENYNGADIKKICDVLIHKVIEQEINNVMNYSITFEDCVEALKTVKSSVSIADMVQMKEFKNNSL